MARGCNCAGNTCGCSVTGGTGIDVTGIGTASSPFQVSLNDTSISVGPRIDLDATTTVELTSLGTGTALDPLVIKAAVVLRSPDNSRWTLTVTNAGVIGATKL